MSEKKKIAIIGGGIAGLTFARCLAKQDYELHIFEKKAEFGEIGAAISVFPNALCVYETLHYPRTENIVQQSLKLGKMGQLENPVLIGLRNLAFKLMPSNVAMKLIDRYFSYRVTKVDI